MISEAFKFALYSQRMHGRRMYQIAAAAGVSPSTLSAILHGIRPVRQGDPRVILIGRELGLEPEQCFAAEAAQPPVSTWVA